MDPTWQNITLIVGSWGQGVGSLVTALALGLAYKEYRRAQRRDLEAERATLEARQLEIYQRLELESMTVFRYETDHRHLIHWYKTHLAPSGAPPFTAPLHEAELCARKYYEMSCNLFEIAIRLREKNAGYVEDEVFGSWVAWFFDVLCEWGFRAAWADLRDNYTPTLRQDVFDPFVAELILTWDQPHAGGAGSDQNLRQPDEIVDAMRTRFYAALGDRFGCDSAKCWLDMRQANPLPVHPRAYA